MVKSNAVAFNCDLRLADFNKTEDSLRVTDNIWKEQAPQKAGVSWRYPPVQHPSV